MAAHEFRAKARLYQLTQQHGIDMKTDNLKPTLLRAVALLVAACAFGASSAQAQTQKEAENFWYAQGTLGMVKASHSDVAAKLSDFVQVSGASFFDRGRTGSIVLGRQSFEEDGWVRDHPARFELEAWFGSAKRSSVRLGALSASTDDTVKARALMANFLARLTDSEEKASNRLPLWRTWFGVGLGYANVSYPSATLSGCNCLRAADSDGEMVVQAKLAVERYIAQDTMLVAQAARVWLPGASFGTGNFPRTQYGDWGVTTYSVGLRMAFR